MHDAPTHSSHEHVHAASPEEALALLKYMLEHNRHHAAELHDLAHDFPNPAGQLIHEAVSSFEAGNAKLEAALAALKES